ncbi:amidohydrolase family protein [Alkalicoccobacillus gibsonii]|uniref:Amidohydrolase family protein n=1 Tax=Alkalicoccobacillus gibsonii TaxID=79881 RepID=A0ABU9VES0_9BACI
MKIFDAHLHIIDKRFPLYENQGFTPDSYTGADYVVDAKRLSITNGAIVSGSFQKFDQTYLKESLKQLGSGFVGVTQLPHTTSDEEILELNKAGVRGLRFNVNRGGSEDLSKLEAFSNRVYDLVGWHTELYINSAKLADIYDVLTTLPAVSIDHLGLSESGSDDLLKLVSHGVKVKATGFGRLDFDAGGMIKDIYRINSEALMFGTDLPSTRAPKPFQASDIDLVKECLKDDQAIHKVLYQNAMDWYFRGKGEEHAL